LAHGLNKFLKGQLV